MSTSARRYLLVTPCRNEAEYLEKTIASVAAQTLLPSRWVIVDDGSSDGTTEILAEAARRHGFIEVVRREDRGRRAVGPGVVDAFYAGLEAVDLGHFDYLCKLDADLELPPGYFETVVKEFERDAYLGTLSGKLYYRHGGRLLSERIGDENSVGAAKFYSTHCFQDIGGFVRGVNWDGIDGHMCRLKGWIARSEEQPGLRIVHLRQMGSSQKSLWTGRLRWGGGKYFMGSALYYVLAASLFRALERPFVVGGLGILIGYLRAMARREPRFEGPAGYRRFLRGFELRCLLLGKQRAIARYHDRIRARFPPPPERPRAPGAVGSGSVGRAIPG